MVGSPGGGADAAGSTTQEPVATRQTEVVRRRRTGRLWRRRKPYLGVGIGHLWRRMKPHRGAGAGSGRPSHPAEAAGRLCQVHGWRVQGRLYPGLHGRGELH